MSKITGKATNSKSASAVSANPKPALKTAKTVKIEKLDVKGNGLSYRGFATIKGKVCTVKVKGSWETFSPGCEVPSSEILELAEASAAQLKRYDKAGQKKIDYDLLMAA